MFWDCIVLALEVIPNFYGWEWEEYLNILNILTSKEKTMQTLEDFLLEWSSEKKSLHGIICFKIFWFKGVLVLWLWL